MALLLIGKYILSHYKFEKRQFEKIKMVGQVGLGASEDLESVVRSRTSPGIPRNPQESPGIPRNPQNPQEPPRNPGNPPECFHFFDETQIFVRRPQNFVAFSEYPNFDSNNNNCDSLKFLGTPLLRILMKPKRKESGCQNLKSPAQTDSAVC